MATVRMMATASIKRFGEYIGLEKPIILKFTDAKSYYGKYETELAVADTIEICHVITISTRYAISQEMVDSTMAHEMVHAKQVESGYEACHDEDYYAWETQIYTDFGIDIEERI